MKFLTNRSCLSGLAVVLVTTSIFYSTQAVCWDWPWAKDECVDPLTPKKGDLYSPIEQEMHDVGVVAASLSDNDVEDFCSAAGSPLRSAFLQGTHQGVSGERFTTFYSKNEDKMKELTDQVACSEYGQPYKGDKPSFDFFMQSTAFSRFFDYFDRLSSPVIRTVVNWMDKVTTLFKWTSDVKQFVTGGLTRKSLDQELKEELRKQPVLPTAKTANGERPRIDVQALIQAFNSKEEFGKMPLAAKQFGCCMKGFLTGHLYLNARINSSDNNPSCQPGLQDCKTLYKQGLDKAENACKTGNCSGCALEQMITDTKNSGAATQNTKYGCLSSGFLEAIQSSDRCEELRAKMQDARDITTNEARTKTGESTGIAERDTTAGSATGAQSAN